MTNVLNAVVNLMKRELKDGGIAGTAEAGATAESHEERIESSPAGYDHTSWYIFLESHEERIESAPPLQGGHEDVLAGESHEERIERSTASSRTTTAGT